MAERSLFMKKRPAGLAGLVKTALLALLLGLLIRSTCLESYKIPNDSMAPALLAGDYVFVHKAAYHWRLPFSQTIWQRSRLPKRGDVVVFLSPHDKKKRFIKRLIGLPGDEVVFQDGTVSVNGTVLLSAPPGEAVVAKRESFMVPSEAYFVLGDNLSGGSDSRDFGYVPAHNLLGKGLMIYFSYDSLQKKLRLERFFKEVI